MQASHLKSHIGFWLRLVSNHVSHAFARKLDDSGVTVAEWVILREMYDQETSPGHIAELTGLTKGAVSKLMDRLLDKKFITREYATDDKRFQKVKLTKKSKDLVPKLAALADKNDKEFFSGLSAAEKRELVAILQKVAMSKKLKRLPIT